MTCYLCGKKCEKAEWMTITSPKTKITFQAIVCKECQQN